MMIWQLQQMRRLRDTPRVFAGHMWQGLVDWASAQMLRPGFELASPQDMQIFVLRRKRRAGGGSDPEHHARWLNAPAHPA